MKGFKRKIRDHKILRWSLLFSTWVFQGILRADVTEKWFKVSFSIITSILITWLLSIWLRVEWAIALGCLGGHTLNWFVNNNICVLLVHLLLVKKISKKAIFDYLDYLQAQLAGKDWVLYAVVLGSISRGDLKPSSDIDVSIVRKPGFVNACKAIGFSIWQKGVSDLQGIPMELYISDRISNSVNRYKDENKPVILAGNDSIVHSNYPQSMTLKDAKRLNTYDQ